MCLPSTAMLSLCHSRLQIMLCTTLIPRASDPHRPSVPVWMLTTPLEWTPRPFLDLSLLPSPPQSPRGTTFHSSLAPLEHPIHPSMASSLLSLPLRAPTNSPTSLLAVIQLQLRGEEQLLLQGWIQLTLTPLKAPTLSGKGQSLLPQTPHREWKILYISLNFDSQCSLLLSCAQNHDHVLWIVNQLKFFSVISVQCIMNMQLQLCELFSFVLLIVASFLYQLPIHHRSNLNIYLDNSLWQYNINIQSWRIRGACVFDDHYHNTC